jgi:hypothetical protein
MSLIHALVADAASSTILVECSTGRKDFSNGMCVMMSSMCSCASTMWTVADGPVPVAVQKILEKIPPNNSKLTCESEGSVNDITHDRGLQMFGSNTSFIMCQSRESSTW